MRNNSAFWAMFNRLKPLFYILGGSGMDSLPKGGSCLGVSIELRVPIWVPHLRDPKGGTKVAGDSGRDP